MDRTPASQSLADSLGRIIAFDADGRALWPAEELKSILKRQLQSELPGHPDDDSLRTFADLFVHPHPPLSLLLEVKALAKSHRFVPGSPIPPEICLLLYYGTIIIALLKLNQRITRLEDQDLRNGLNWVVRQPWVDESTLALFRDGLDHLRTGRAQWRN